MQSHQPISSTQILPASIRVLKRDRSTSQDWDINRVEKAITAAYRDVNLTPNGEMCGLLSKVEEAAVIRVGEALGENPCLSVDEIQQIVKDTLMTSGLAPVAEAYIVYAANREAIRKARLKPDPSAVADYIHLTKYSRYLPQLKRREVREETINRCRDMHAAKFPQAADLIEKAFEKVHNRFVLPSMRSLQFGGQASVAHNAKIYNCAFSVANRVEFFREAFHLLLCGTGVGFSVQWQHVDSLPELKFVDEQDVKHIVIEDSIEGWADALHDLVNSYVTGQFVEFAYNKVRKRGVPLKTSGGRAPGHVPLRRSLERVRAILHGAQGRQLKPIECYDIMCMAADAVYSGGIREAAMICLFSIDDGEMMNAKTGDWWQKTPWRCRSNNSVVLVRGNVDKQQYKRIFRSTKQFGEPGFYWTSDADTGCNPCLSGDTMLLTGEGYKSMRDLWVEGGSHEYCKTTPPDDYGRLSIVNSHGAATATNVYRTSTCADLFRVTFKDGGWIDATSNHTFFRIEGGEEKRCKLHDLVIGDEVPLQIQHASFGTYHDPEYATISGWCIGDGSVCNRDGQQAGILRFWDDDIESVMPSVREAMLANYARHNTSSNQNPTFDAHAGNTDGFEGMRRMDMWSNVLGRMLKEDGVVVGSKHRVPSRIWGGDRETVASFLRALFSADGHPEASYAKKAISVRLTQRTDRIELLQGVQALLGQFGIPSVISKPGKPSKVWMNDGKGGKKEYVSRGSRRLIIGGRKDVLRFLEVIGFTQPRKMEVANAWLAAHHGSNNSNTERMHRAIASIDPIGAGETFCLTEFANNEIIVNSTRVGNCVEIGLNPKLSITPSIKTEIEKWAKATGRKIPKLTVNSVYWGFQMCNLSEVNCAATKTVQDFNESVQAATIIGSLQAGWNDFPYLGWVSEFIIQREALLGVSLTGMMDTPEIAFDPEVQRHAAQLAVETNVMMAEILGINPSARITCVKPSGCRPAEALTLTTGGILTLKELMRDHAPGQEWSNVTRTVSAIQHGGNANKVTRSFANGTAETIKIRMNYGLTVESTLNHRWFVKEHRKYGGKSGIVPRGEWVEAASIRVGDVIEVESGLYPARPPTDLLIAPLIRKDMDHSSHEIRMPAAMSEDLAWLLGYMWGDGCQSEAKSRIRFTDQHTQHLQKVVRICDSEFGLMGNIKPCSDGRDASVVEIGSIHLWGWMKENGLMKYDGEEVNPIPLAIRTSTRSHIAAFMAGLVDSDGCVSLADSKSAEKRRNGGGEIEYDKVNVHVTGAVDNFIDHVQHVGWAIGLRWGMSLNSHGNNHQSQKHVNMLFLAAGCDKEAFEELRRNSVKMSAITGINFNAVDCEPNLIVGKVVAIEEGSMKPTFDVEVENEPWFFAGSVKSHNTASKHLGGVASGCHTHHARRYFSRIRATPGDPVYEFFKKHNPHMCTAINQEKEIITYPIQAPDGALTRHDLTAIEFLQKVLSTMKNWVLPGTALPNSSPGITHNVSNTVTVKPHEWEEVCEFIWEHREFLSGISLLSDMGDKVYENAPREEVVNEADEAKWQMLIRDYVPVDWTKMTEEADNTTLVQEAACSGGSCEIAF